MSLTVITNGQPIKVPRDVEAKGGEAVERWVKAQAEPTSKAKAKKGSDK